MSPYPHPIIAREGWPFVAIASVAMVVLAWLGGAWGGLAGLALVAFVVQFFRDPPRQVPAQPNVVLSPADGRIVSVGKSRDPWLERDALKISVFMNVFNVHSNRSPVDAEVRNAWYRAGAFVNAELDKASDENERNALHLRTKDGRDVTCVQVAGLIARRIICQVQCDDTVRRGQRFGMICFGSRLDVYLPQDVTPAVSVGDRVQAGTSILGSFPDGDAHP